MAQAATSTEVVGEERATLRLVPGLASLADGLPDTLPDHPGIDESVPHAPKRPCNLTPEEFRLALQNALRYFPKHMHATLAPEFAQELRDYGHVYMYRFRPTTYEMKAYPIDKYPAKSKQAASVIHMIMNNLDARVAQFPHELVTYGGNGCVFQNWAQYHLVMKYLCEMTEEQTLAMYSGHPMGLFPSSRDAPRVVVSNGMVIPHYSFTEDFNRMFAMGVTMYGQMTAGSYAYIGPQGIVHGTTLTVLNAGRKFLTSGEGVPSVAEQSEDSPLAGRVFVTSGLGGMSGAQPKAGKICGAIAVVAEISKDAVEKRHSQGWVDEKFDKVDDLVDRVRKARADKEGVSIAYFGNIVDLWEKFAELAEGGEMLVDLGSDQTSLHNPFNGGYYPVGFSYDEANDIMAKDPEKFKELVQASLRRHVDAVNRLTAKGMYFWDYGNSFLLEASRAGADVFEGGKKGDSSRDKFRYPSYVEDIMGDIFSLGFGPFRWVCTSGKPEDLDETDKISADVIKELMAKEEDPEAVGQFKDNLHWIVNAKKNKLVVGSQARILYSDARGRTAIAVAFNKAIAEGRISGPIVLSRDHHDVSGTDSPFRETSNIRDGSKFTADMAIQNVIGDAARGATWVSIHNGGGVGWGEVTNGGFGLVLDGSEDAERRARNMLWWDVNNGVARRAWSRHDGAERTIRKAMEDDPRLKVTMPNHCDEDILNSALSQ
uniref:urocanate hydratase n=1 Tax=Palpitomonas bilix TaxID=652834 RepID=A0A7S3GLR5_9EUKA|mmetsp:Transcript_9076/g.24658  ORF Transcript_9076/g.24658 Transcript_9076/m.24658 type:complete len:712 (+) Transcript_9076:20-2155(+)|eukprot:CAMPEP_0113875652 /NCGR_PEP_ID=MMETSP0780_2-20120614/5059_1 /TAXON_ID=652834 /ORGANISM="Palpitomonas bilix" /LENGTH=711 /DNA_ID=CAMNT_0000861661 /DNA_START=20 /DNA_END=2158 /DNA_ORIENTATION=+ /assembly_acc=CAM_ASM_000599